MAPKRASKKAAAPPPPLPPPAETRSDESEDDDASADSPVRAATPAVKTAPLPSHKDREEDSSSSEEMCLLYPYLAEVVKQLEAKYPTSFKRKFGKMEDDKARAMDDKFKRHRAEQIKQDMRLSDLTKQATKALVDILDV